METENRYTSVWGKLKNNPRVVNGLLEIQIGSTILRIRRDDQALKVLKPHKLRTKVMVIFWKTDDGVCRVLSSVPTDSYRLATQLQEAVRQGEDGLEDRVNRIMGRMIFKENTTTNRTFELMYLKRIG